ncbi:uncharacterized protein L201_003883 [Kwoniella dendrophila CBS 6074]|uniref:Uncharacterized protein n=1 Tax=Kwoniella dendrophila CBS 6074 TaxID=1295534 RepID=A0AAX4JVP7_9TREE
MTYKRLLTSLASHPPSASPSRLIPPYAQSLPSSVQSPSSSLRPPYTHSVPVNVEAKRSSRLKSPKQFELLLSSGSAKKNQSVEWNAWRKEILSNDQSRKDIEGRWREVIANLERIKEGQHEIPQIDFQQLSSNLRSESTVGQIKSTGLVIVRDVVRDSEAIEWAREVLLSTEERGGRAVYWHSSLLAARANPSILSANSQLSAALLQVPDVYITASSIIEGLHPSPTIPHSSDPWTTPQSLLSHLTLTPSIPTSSTIVSPTILAAEYSALRPLFRSIKSKISFYSNSGYLDPENWELNDNPSTIPNISTSNEGEFDLPHLKEVKIIHPELRPGDMVYHHASLPISTSKNSGQVFLPVTPISKKGEENQSWINGQRESFENGLPPPNELLSHEALYQVEEKGHKGLINSRAGKEAMGY